MKDRLIDAEEQNQKRKEYLQIVSEPGWIKVNGHFQNVAGDGRLLFYPEEELFTYSFLDGNQIYQEFAVTLEEVKQVLKNDDFEEKLQADSVFREKLQRKQ